MANYDKQTWVARVALGDNRFEDQDGNLYEFTPAPTSVTTAGSAFSASRMNYMEDGIALANNVVTKTSDFSYNYSGGVGTGEIISAHASGGWVAVRVRVNNTSAVASGATFAMGVVDYPAGYMPLAVTESIGQYNGTPLLAVLDTGGNVTVTNIGTSSIASGHSARFTFVYPRG